MSDNSGSETGAFLAGFVIGGLVGAAAALIMAPQSGAATRAEIAARSEELRRTGEQRLQEYRLQAERAAEEARHKVEETTEQVQEQARIVLDEGKAKVAETLETAQSKVEGAAGALRRETHKAAEKIDQAEQKVEEVAEDAAETAEDAADEAEDRLEGQA